MTPSLRHGLGLATVPALQFAAGSAWAQSALPGADLPPAMLGDLPHDLSPWAMFVAADLVVKAVMVGLAFAALLTWVVLVAKLLEIAGAKARAHATLRALTAARTLDDAIAALQGLRGACVTLLLAAD